MRTVHGAHGVNNIPGEEQAARGYNGLTCGESGRKESKTELPALRENVWPTGTMYGAVDAASAEERGVGRVNDDVDILGRDVTDSCVNEAV